jgi:hypothetical protein
MQPSNKMKAAMEVDLVMDTEEVTEEGTNSMDVDHKKL